ncbi:hypothetical protein FAUST_6207 [Fusarium austroamericanum]|uniref:Uncharacterized protein n=1 Tax=Fusarium austroamericanum TaxID=282268 RepID=A0AAN6HDV2_FUSAU|nr:hypothetical protein FAUST_6207 [Fusarium austroamericanum]
MLVNGVPYIVAITIADAKPSPDGRTCGLFKPSQGLQMRLLHENVQRNGDEEHHEGEDDRSSENDPEGNLEDEGDSEDDEDSENKNGEK